MDALIFVRQCRIEGKIMGNDEKKHQCMLKTGQICQTVVLSMVIKLFCLNVLFKYVSVKYTQYRLTSGTLL